MDTCLYSAGSSKHVRAVEGHVNFDLADLFFGRDDAELDIVEGGLLLAGFLPTPAYEAARRARKHLIIGRKGSGKSAICRTLAVQDGPGVVTALVTPDTLSADEIRRFELQGVESGMAKRMIWRYVLTVQIAKHLVAHAKAAHKKTPAVVNKLHTFLVDNGELDVSRPKLYESIKKLKTSLKLQAFGIAVEIGSPSEGTRADYQLEVIERHLELAIKELACPEDHPRLLILVDQLEDVWSEESESDSLVIGLLKAARAAGSRFPRISCVVFLRSDIYELLRFADKDKYRGDEMWVDWSSERLRELVLARACASLGSEIGEDRLWGEIFPGAISGVPAWEYVVAHTLMRPRDIIHLCNLCRDTAESNGHATITEADVTEAVRQYSQWKLEDPPNEYLANYPFLDGLLAVFKDHGYIVTRAALNWRLSEVHGVLAERFPERTESLTTDNVLDMLYDIGFLGVRHNDNIVYAAHTAAASNSPTLCFTSTRRFGLRSAPPAPPSLRFSSPGNCATSLKPESPRSSRVAVPFDVHRSNIGCWNSLNAASAVYCPNLTMSTCHARSPRRCPPTC
jgi:hypothetical protein